jgi:hypothetical protein
MCPMCLCVKQKNVKSRKTLRGPYNFNVLVINGLWNEFPITNNQ